TMMNQLPYYPVYEWQVVGDNRVLFALSTAIVTAVLNGVFDYVFSGLMCAGRPMRSPRCAGFAVNKESLQSVPFYFSIERGTAEPQFC
ncbi:hypothetical protein ACTHI9_27325, partial [Citrobacter freundii]